MDSSSKAVAHRATSDLHQQPGGTLMSALAPHAFVPSRRGHRRWPPGSCLAARGELDSGAWLLSPTPNPNLG